MLGRVHRPSAGTLSAGWPTGPPRPPAPTAAVHIWRAELDAPGWPGAERLPAAERERTAAILRPEPARRWIASRWALREVLGRYLGEDPAAIALRAREHGKPELAELPGRLDFNLSHSAGLALVAVTVGRPVGVDVERIDPDRDLLALAERGLDPEEAAAVRAAAPGTERASHFYAAWVRREALVKCLGGGLGNPAPAEPVALLSLEPGKGYAAALAAAGSQTPVQRHYSVGPRR